MLNNVIEFNATKNVSIEENVNVKNQNNNTSDKLPDGEYSARFVKVEKSRINVGKHQFTNLKFVFDVDGKILIRNIVKHRGYITDINDGAFIYALTGINTIQRKIAVPTLRFFEGDFYRIIVVENDFYILGSEFYDW